MDHVDPHPIPVCTCGPFPSVVSASTHTSCRHAHLWIPPHTATATTLSFLHPPTISQTDHTLSCWIPAHHKQTTQPQPTATNSLSLRTRSHPSTHTHSHMPSPPIPAQTHPHSLSPLSCCATVDRSTIYIYVCICTYCTEVSPSVCVEGEEYRREGCRRWRRSCNG